MENAMTDPTGTPTPPAVPGPPAATPSTPPPATPPPAADKQPPWGKPEDFNPEKAWELIQNLRNEKGGADPTVKAELDQLRADQQKQRDALATALGVKPEETSDSDKLAQQIDGLRSQIIASEKRALAVEFKVPEAMLTAPDADSLRQQATALAEFAQAAHYAALTAAPATPPPAFQANPGQGQGNTQMTPEAQAAAEYEKYYPSTPSK
jgi:hypothetical protein